MLTANTSKLKKEKVKRTYLRIKLNNNNTKTEIIWKPITDQKKCFMKM